jgi:predicted DNA-binding transcriptional regulator YafY
MKDLPLHPSQIVAKEDGDSVYFALRLIPNPNFIMELCRHGAALEVLSPQSLREEVAARLEQALKLYRGN